MPFIDLKTTRKFNNEELVQLKFRLGEIISIIPGKSESVLMIGIDANSILYFSGKDDSDYAYVEIKLFGKAPFESKFRFTEALYELLEDEFAIPRNSVFLNFTEFDNWAYQGRLSQ